MTKRISIVILSAMIMSLNATGISSGDREYFTHHRFAISGMLSSSDTWTLEGSYHYMLLSYIGVGGSIGFWDTYYTDGYASGNNWRVDSDTEGPSNFFMRPSIVFRSPSFHVRDVYLGLYAEPGLMMNVPYQRVTIAKTQGYIITDYDYPSTTKGQWCAMDCRLGVYADIGPCSLSLGYIMSNFDTYSMFRHINYCGESFSSFYPKKPFMQGVYLTLSYNF